MSGETKRREADVMSGDWAAFERAVDVVVKAPPQHRSRKKSAAADASSKRFMILMEAVWISCAELRPQSERFRQRVRELSLFPDRWVPGSLQGL